jgi:matrix metalloproteinase-14 (membrane-inserted)
MNNGLYLFLGQGHGSYFNKNTNQFLGDFIFTGLSGNWPANFKTPKGGMRIGSQLYYFQYEPDAENAQYLRFDTNTQAIDAGFPRKVSQDWAAGTWPAPWNCVDAAVNWGNGKAYFFSGARYLRYDIRQDRVDPGYPLPIQGNWPGWPSTWTQVRAAVNWGNGKVYFFFGPDYLRYDIRSDRVDPGFPANTQANWPGLSAPWVPDSAVNWGSGKAYFFLGDHYYRYDVAADHFDTGYPKPILGNWAGWPVDGLGQLMPYRAGVLWGVPLGPGRVYLPLVKK